MVFSMNDSYACPNCGGFIKKGHPHECKRPSVSFPIDINHVQIIPFAKAMDEILTKNDYKGGWNECKVSYLRARLVEELGEYFARVAINIDYESTKPLDARDKELERKELVDIANFAMMLWDRS